MASTVTAQNLEVSITESITLAGTNYNQTKTLTIPSIKEVFKRVVSLYRRYRLHYCNI